MRSCSPRRRGARALALALALALTLTLARCAFVSWVGPDVSGMERARVSMHRSDVQNHVRPVVSFDLQEREEVDVQCEAVRRSIAAQLGASVLSYDGQVCYLVITPSSEPRSSATTGRCVAWLSPLARGLGPQLRRAGALPSYHP